MSSQSKMSLSARLMMVSATILFICGVSLGFAVYEISEIHGISVNTSEYWLPRMTKISELNTKLTEYRMIQNRMAATEDLDDLQSLIDRLQKVSEKVSEDTKKYALIIANDQMAKSELDQLVSQWEKYKGISDQFLSMLLNGNRKEAFYIHNTTGEAAYSTIDKFVNNLVEQGIQGSLKAKENARLKANSAKSFTVIIMSFSVIMGLVLSALVARKVRKNLETVTDGLRSAVQSVFTKGTSLADAAQKLSSASVEQATSTQETSAAITEIRAMVEKNQENSKSSADLFSETEHAATRGSQSVGEMVGAITEIADANKSIEEFFVENSKDVRSVESIIREINEKTQVINEIVFQTKLLSFNASVEAARAGERGRGFAIVAEEVGKLAEMSGDASRDISELIVKSSKKVVQIVQKSEEKIKEVLNNANEKVNSGREVATQCSQDFNQILSLTKTANLLSQEALSSATEQARGIREIANAIESFDGVITHNTKLSESNLNESQALLEEAQRLQGAIHILDTEILGSSAVAAQKSEPISQDKIYYRPARRVETERTVEKKTYERKPTSSASKTTDTSSSSRKSREDLREERYRRYKEMKAKRSA